MKDTRIAVRYAKALFDLSKEQNLLEQVNIDMQFVSDVCTKNKDFRGVLASPVIKANKKISIFKEIFSDRISKMSLGFLNIIMKKRRENNIVSITSQFAKIYNEYKDIEIAYVTSPIPLDESQKLTLIEVIKKKSQKSVKLIEKIDPEIIGGFILNFGGNIYDSSIKDKAKMVERELVSF
ncbi:MAG: ATP synthase F1 subunit delta [Bacteroidota bacterium]|nr:ATP synthase F1 subunit delta [Bacteroidota bacterium]